MKQLLFIPLAALSLRAFLGAVGAMEPLEEETFVYVVFLCATNLGLLIAAYIPYEEYEEKK